MRQQEGKTKRSTSQGVYNYEDKSIFQILTLLSLIIQQRLENSQWASFMSFNHLLRTSRHYWTAFLSAKICDGAIQHVDLVEEIHSWKNAKKRKLLKWCLCSLFSFLVHHTLLC